MAKLRIVHCKDFNGYQALFCMKSDDLRFDTENYVDLGPLKKVGKSFLNPDTGRVYTRASDWSLKEITIAN